MTKSSEKRIVKRMAKAATRKDEFPMRSAVQILRALLNLFGKLLLHPFSMPWRYVPTALSYHLRDLWWAVIYGDWTSVTSRDRAET